MRTPALNSNARTDNGTDIVKTDFGLLTLNSVFSPTLLNELRIQVGRDFEQQLPNAPGPGTSVTGGFAYGMPNFLPRQKYPNERRYQILNAVTMLRGAHSIKMGLDINYVREDIENLFQGGGIYSYSNLQNIAADCPPDAAGCVPLQDANTGRHYTSFNQAFDLRPGHSGDLVFNTSDYSFYVNDTWRASRSLTLNLGLRYEYQKLPQPEQSNPAYPLTQSIAQDKNNLGPRLGFTYDVGANHKTVFKGGFGIYYGLTSNSYIFSALTNNAVTFATFNFTPTTAGAPIYPNVLAAPPTGPGVRPAISVLSSDLERPEMYMGDLTIERSIGSDLVVSASYLYSKGKKLPDLHRHQPRERELRGGVHAGHARTSGPSPSTGAPVRTRTSAAPSRCARWPSRSTTASCCRRRSGGATGSSSTPTTRSPRPPTTARTPPPSSRASRASTTPRTSPSRRGPPTSTGATAGW